MYSRLIRLFLATILLTSCASIEAVSTPVASTNLKSTPQTSFAIATATNIPVSTVVPTSTDSPTPTVTRTPTPTPVVLSPLSIQGTDFFADGKRVILRGVVTNHFVYRVVDRPSYYFPNFNRDIDKLKEMGANFVVIEWNSGYVDDPDYVEHLVEGLEYARARGFRVELVLHSRGRRPGSTWDGVQITVADDQIIRDWDRLLSDANLTTRIARNVDIFGPIAELEKNVQGQYVTWKDVNDIDKQTVYLIRRKTGKPKAIGAFIGIGFAGDARDALNDPQRDRMTAIEVHPYEWKNKDSNIKTFVPAARAKGMAVFVGEFGCQVGPGDTIAYAEDLTKFFVTNNVSFAFYGINSDTTNAQCSLVTKNGQYTPLGNLALKYLTAEK